MDRSGAQHPQEMATETLGSMMVCPNTQQVEKKPKPQLEEALKCPRCDSNNTKFCYYNNYSLSQPRYFCKSCKRYWTQGGTLRNVPVGGGCRKTKRSPSKGSQDQPITSMNIMPNPHYSNDLSLAFSGPHCEGLGNPNFQRDAAAMFLDAPPNGFFQNLCYGNGNGDLGNGRGEEGEENRVLWGIPWQNMGGGDGNWMGNFDTSGRESWNGGAASFNWHGIVNGPLV